MTTEETTITAPDSSPGEAGTESEQHIPVFLDEDPEPTPDVAAEPEPEPEAPDADEPGKDEESRYDKDPEFKKRIDELNGSKAKLDAASKEIETIKATLEATNRRQAEELASLKALLGRQQTGKDEKAPQFKNIAGLKPGEVHEWVEQDPVGFYSNLMHQINHELGGKLPKQTAKGEIVREVLTELSNLSKRQTVNQSTAAFIKKHPEFADATKSPADFLAAVADKLENSGKASQEAIDKAVAEALEKAEKDRLKEGADSVVTPIKPGPSAKPRAKTEIKRRPGESEDAFIARKVGMKLTG